jgi:very-short-patch-repair endonuclease
MSTRPPEPSTCSAQRARILHQRASAMRSAPTSTEARFFEAVRGRQLGVAFRRQVPLLGRYIADFLVPALKLIVEIDGEVHANRRQADARRDRALRRAGYSILRTDARFVRDDVTHAVSVVRAEIERLASG